MPEEIKKEVLNEEVEEEQEEKSALGKLVDAILPDED